MYTQVFEYEYDYHTQKMMGIEYGYGYGYLPIPIPILNTQSFGYNCMLTTKIEVHVFQD